MDKVQTIAENWDVISMTIGALLGILFPKKTVAGKIGALLTKQKP